MDVNDINLRDKQLLSRAFEAFDTSIRKLREYQSDLEGKVEFLNGELHRKNEELTNVLQSLSSGLIVTDLEGKIQTFNRAAVNITGISKDEAHGKTINTLLDYPVLPERLNKSAYQEISANYHQQFTFPRSDGSEIIIDSTTTLMESDESELQGIILNLSDITLLKRLEEEAERKNRLTAMGQIAMQVAHEIRNPLGSIELFASMMKMDFDEESNEMELMNHISSAVQSMNHIISNLLEYSRPKPISLDVMEVHELLGNFVDFSRFSAAQQMIDIDFFPDAEQTAVKGNKELLKQVFHNLFVNACQAMPEGGIFAISTDNYVEKDPLILERFKGQYIPAGKGLALLKITFSDTGKGMSEEVKRRLFDPFFTTREQGTGLGMSIVHKTMLSHGGTILVESVLEKGTKVIILLPLSPED